MTITVRMPASTLSPNTFSSAEAPIVYIVDDDKDARQSLGWLVKANGHEVLEFADPRAFLDRYEAGRCGCLLLDLRMPDINGLRLQAMLNARNAQVPIVLISGHVDVKQSSEAFRAGAFDVMTKPIDGDVLLKRIAEALLRDAQRIEREGELAAKNAALTMLSPRERQVFDGLLHGLSLKQVASRLDLAYKTAAKHRARVLEKLGVDSDANLVRIHAASTLLRPHFSLQPSSLSQTG